MKLELKEKLMKIKNSKQQKSQLMCSEYLVESLLFLLGYH